MLGTRFLAPCAAAAAAAITFAPAAAGACGGFFCSSASPVDQDGELIAFDVEGGQVTMHVQVKYEGPTEQFAWILPIPADHPDQPVSVGTEALFQALLNSTMPTVSLRQRTEGECLPDPERCYEWMWDSDDAPSAGEGEGEGEGEVQVLLQQQVGPYDVVVLAADNAGVMLQWLNDNEYDIPETTEPLLQLYVGDSHFVAMKLTKDAGAGDVQPIVLRFAGDVPMIPLRLTSVAATPDMPIYAWLLGEGRGVPLSFSHVTLNEARIPWQSCGGWQGCRDRWTSLVGQAADEAGGRAFATAFAGRSAEALPYLPDPDRFDLDRLRRTHAPWDFVQDMLQQGFPRDTKMQALLRRFIPMPAGLAEQGVDERSFYNCLRCYQEQIERAGLEFDPMAFVEALAEEVVEPLVEVRGRFEQRPDLTLLYTQLSADEMTEDPVFGFNPDLPDVARDHFATLVYQCEPDVLRSDAAFRLEAADGAVLHAGSPQQEGRGAYSPDEALPAALLVERQDVEGPPIVLTDNREEVAARLRQAADAALAALPGPVRRDPSEVTCEAVCCRQDDPCGWQWNGRCDCDGALPWDWSDRECGARTCEPGETVACACPGGTTGVQRCDRAGERFEACACDEEAPPETPACLAGQWFACLCGDGRTGAQQCAEDGSRVLPCDCDDQVGQPRPGGDGGGEGEGESVPEGGPATLCVPGRNLPCTCGNGERSGQACLDDGSGYAACVCDGEGPVGGGPGVEPRRTEPKPLGCACRAVAGSGGGAWAALAALALTVWRRRSGTRP